MLDSIAPHGSAAPKQTASKHFSDEVKQSLYDALRRRITGEAATDCQFTSEDLVKLVEETKLTREQISDWGKNFRKRNKIVKERLSKIDSEDPETVHALSHCLADNLLSISLSIHISA